MTVPGNPQFLFTARSRTDILRNPDNYNTNNHQFHHLPPSLQAIEKYPKPPNSPAYLNSLRSTNYTLFRPLLTSLQNPPSACPLPSNLSGTILLSGRNLRLLHDAAKIGFQLNRVSEVHREDLDDVFLPLLAPYFPPREPRRYFLRVNECSPKDGRHRMGPFLSPAQIIEGVVTSTRVFKALRRAVEEGGEECLHLVPWREDISAENEWRVFVPANGRIRAVSQYSERDAGWRVELPEHRRELEEVMRGVLRVVEKLVGRAGEAGGLPEEGCVVDVHAARRAGRWVVEPVEVNGFGAQMASGSGLFNWLWDWERMYGGEEVVEVRVVGAEEG